MGRGAWPDGGGGRAHTLARFNLTRAPVLSFYFRPLLGEVTSPYLGCQTGGVGLDGSRNLGSSEETTALFDNRIGVSEGGRALGVR